MDLNDPVAFWHLQEPGPFLDAIGSVDLLDTTTSIDTGLFGNARHFDVSEYLYTGYAYSALVPAGSFAWMVLFRLAANWIEGTLVASTDGDDDRRYWLAVVDGTLRWRVSADGATWVTVEGPAVSSDAWHVAVAYLDTGANVIGVSLDGGAPLTEPFNGNVFPGTEAALYLGNSPEGVLFVGLIDEIGLWAGVPTQDDLDAFYNAGSFATYRFTSINLYGEAENVAQVQGVLSLSVLLIVAEAESSSEAEGRLFLTLNLAGESESLAEIEGLLAPVVVDLLTEVESRTALEGTLSDQQHPNESVLQRFVVELGLRVRDLVAGPGYGAVVLNNDGFRQGPTRLGPSTTPPASRASYDTHTIPVAGQQQVDCLALTGTQRRIRGAGKSVRFLYVRNRGSGVLTVAPGDSQALAPFGAGNAPEIPAGGSLTLYVPGGIPVTTAAHNLKLTGTAADEIDLALILG
jgi:hypothetical protein